MRFSEVVGREYSDFRRGHVHNLTVDTYQIQHPPEQSPRAVKSMAVHLITLYLQLEQGWTSMQAAYGKQQLAAHSAQFEWLEPPADPGHLTIAEVHAAESPEAHVVAVEAWASCVWDAWAAHHAVVKGWAQQFKVSPD